MAVHHRVIAKLCHHEILSVATKYGIDCLDVPVYHVKNCIWRSFADIFIGFIGYTVVHVSFLFCMVMCMLLCTVICSPRLKCPVLCADFIVLAFCIFIPYCCDFCAAFRRNKE